MIFERHALEEMWRHESEAEAEEAAREERAEPAEQQAEPPAPAKPVCSTCCDTHRMTLHEREVMCTRCPVPCERCRSKPQGPYCAVTPCPCECHRKREPANSPEIPDGSDLDKSARST